MFSFSVPELILVLVVALLVFGPSKLPEIGKAFGKGLREFKDATGGAGEEAKKTALLEASPKEQGK